MTKSGALVNRKIRRGSIFLIDGRAAVWSNPLMTNPLRPWPRATLVAARALGLTPGAISQWKRVPVKHLLAVEAATGIPRERLRPDLYRTLPDMPTKLPKLAPLVED